MGTKATTPISAKRRATSPTRLALSARSVGENPRSAFSPVRSASPSRTRAGRPTDVRTCIQAWARLVFPAPGRPVIQMVPPRHGRPLCVLGMCCPASHVRSQRPYPTIPPRPTPAVPEQTLVPSEEPPPGTSDPRLLRWSAECQRPSGISPRVANRTPRGRTRVFPGPSPGSFTGSGTSPRTGSAEGPGRCWPGRTAAGMPRSPPRSSAPTRSMPTPCSRWVASTGLANRPCRRSFSAARPRLPARRASYRWGSGSSTHGAGPGCRPSPGRR